MIIEVRRLSGCATTRQLTILMECGINLTTRKVGRGLCIKERWVEADISVEDLMKLSKDFNVTIDTDYIDLETR